MTVDKILAILPSTCARRKSCGRRGPIAKHVTLDSGHHVLRFEPRRRDPVVVTVAADLAGYRISISAAMAETYATSAEVVARLDGLRKQCEPGTKLEVAWEGIEALGPWA